MLEIDGNIFSKKLKIMKNEKDGGNGIVRSKANLEEVLILMLY